MSSRQGTALARRVGQLARGFANRGWKVDVLYRSRNGSTRNEAAARGVTLHGVPDDASSIESGLALIRRLATAWHAAVHGDRSGRWAKRAQARLVDLDASPPDLVIGSFTPRGTLTAARAAAQRWSIPWIADLQDPALEGSRGAVAPLVRRWMRRELASASAVVQVSPEWASADATLLERKVLTLRHAVPRRPRGLAPRTGAREGYVLLYAGSLIGAQQDAHVLMSALVKLNKESDRTVILRVASADATRARFERHLSGVIPTWFQPLGWLTPEELMAEVGAADCLVLIPSNEADRPVVPSKLYEYMAYDRPVLIAGPDSGGVSTVLAEWQHPDVIHRSADAVAVAIDRARSGDNSLMLKRSACAQPPMDEDQFVESYINLATSLVAGVVR